MTPNRAMQYPNFCKLPLAEVETVQKMNLNHTPEKAKKRTLAREQGEQEMETKKMSISVVVSVKHYVCCIYDLRKGSIKSIISDERKSYEVKQ